ncbi:helix-turn-helix domain-containing protein [Enterococcus hirae]|nr:helix-turn-helix domain-containing protein [Enterococcus hirae]
MSCYATKAFKFRIYSNKGQKVFIGRTMGWLQFVYSYFLHL